MQITPERLQHEVGIIWVEDITALDYVREDLWTWCASRQQRPPWDGHDGRMIGYGVLAADAPHNGYPGQFSRRVFWLNTHDRDSGRMYLTGAPMEAVDPRTVAPGVPGVLTDHALGLRFSRGNDAVLLSSPDVPDNYREMAWLGYDLPTGFGRRMPPTGDKARPLACPHCHEDSLTLHAAQLHGVGGDIDINVILRDPPEAHELPTQWPLPEAVIRITLQCSMCQQWAGVEIRDVRALATCFRLVALDGPPADADDDAQETSGGENYRPSSADPGGGPPP
jgi:hypothetical protein